MCLRETLPSKYLISRCLNIISIALSELYNDSTMDWEWQAALKNILHTVCIDYKLWPSGYENGPYCSKWLGLESWFYYLQTFSS